ncbi:MAG: response regulator transcription factor [Actinobacteria bacterium]|nr:response regulator transcription factor [Actinomycetota bacterium]
MPRILIAEDEPRIAEFLEKGLRAAGYSTVAVDDGQLAGSIGRDDDFDLVILDLGLPGMDGIDVLRHIRGSGNRLPVIILTARNELDSTVIGLDNGADDYVTKPFRFEELLARVRARLRSEPSEASTVLSVGNVSLDVRTRRASLGDISIELTAREYSLLETFLRHPDQVLSREQLLDIVWGYDFDPGSNVVEVYIGYLRKKLGNGVIETVRNMGYRLPKPAAS